MKNIVLLGGSGFIGRKLAVELSKHHHVVVLDLVTCNEFSGNQNIEFHPFNFTAPDQDMSVCRDADIVVHLISTLFPEDGTDRLAADIDKNVLSTIRLLDAMKTSPAELVFISSGGTVYGEGSAIPSLETDALSALCTYSLIKIMIEETIKLYGHQHGMNYKIIRLSNPYGYNPNTERTQGAIPIFVHRILNGDPITIWGNGQNTRDYIYLDDAIDAILQVINASPMQEIFNVGSGISYSTMEIIHQIEQHIGDHPPVNVTFSQSRACDVADNSLDVHKMKEVLNWSATHSLEDGIKQVIQEFKHRQVKTQQA